MTDHTATTHAAANTASSDAALNATADAPPPTTPAAALIHRGGQLVGLTHPVGPAAEGNGLELVDAAAPLRLPIRDRQRMRPHKRRRRPVQRRCRTGPLVVRDDVLVCQIPDRRQRWLRR